MSVLSEKRSGVTNNDADKGKSRMARYVYWGAIVGLVCALAVLFVVVYFYGQTIGLTAGDCIVLSCAMTALLSQPAGIVGMVAGAGSGAVCGLLGHLLRTE